MNLSHQHKPHRPSTLCEPPSLHIRQGTYVNHGATGLEGEDDVDVGAIGHSSAGVVGQEELQATNQLPRDTHFDGAGLAQHGDCEKGDSVRT